MSKRQIIVTVLRFCIAKTANLDTANLEAERIASWEDYLRTVEARSIERGHSPAQFLWLDENRKRRDRVRKGQIEVVSIPLDGFVGIPNGLIHDWIGAMFLPNASIEQVLSLLTDYDRYKTIYGPEVVDAKRLSHFEDHDSFTMKIVNKVLFVSGGVNIVCKSQNVRLDDHPAYSISRTINVKEIRDYGRPSERELPADTGDGFIWRLFSVARLEERDGGV